jgi:putative membrane protein
LEKPTNNTKQPLTSYPVLAAKGFCMGAADVVPGVSGGTMAFILGIYEELIRTIRSFDTGFVKLLFSFKIQAALEHVNWRFLLPLILGILGAIFSLAKLLSWVLQNHPVLIWSFFFGLILASVFTVSKHLQQWTPALIIWMLVGAVGIYFLVGLVPVDTPTAPWFLVISGAVAICAMILPGISGSFILVLMGKYHFVLDAVNNRDFLTLLLVALGAGIGLLSFARFLSWVLRKYHDATIAFLTGLMLGSLRKVWPWKKALSTVVTGDGSAHPPALCNALPNIWTTEVFLALGLMTLGAAAIYLLNHMARDKARG